MAQTTSWSGPTREWRRVLTIRLLALAAGVVLAHWTAGLGTHGRGTMLAWAVFGMTAMVGVLIGETVVRPRPTGGPRAASLSPRRVRDFLPWTAPVVATMLVLLVAVLTLTTLTASADSLGASRALACAADGVGNVATPYPGAFYAVPLAITTLAVLAVAALTARQVVLRPRGMAHTEAGEDRLRRNSLDMVVAGAGVALGAPLAGVSGVAGEQLLDLSGHASCAPTWMSVAGPALVVVCLLALGCVAGLLGRLVLRPSPLA